MELNDITLTVVIPCYNEIHNIEKIVNRVLATPIPNMEIIVVDDKSTDGTTELIDEKIAPMVSKVIHHEKNQGKGGALKTGFAAATGDIVIVQDADMEYDPMDYPKVIMPIVKEKARVCYGSRFKKQKAKGYVANRIANKFLTRFSNLFTHQKITDMETCYKAFRRDIIQSIDIEEKRFGFEPEITAKISGKRIKIAEVSISYYPRSVVEGKKIGFKDGLRAIFCILKYGNGKKYNK
ncbi:MAG: glycosyltransferase family 2 protein [Lachnospiraceae bacterium]|nr:glycosyltransferase family 2 protein [Lachnospiraceae bacterium]